MKDFYRTKPHKPGLDPAKQCGESRSFMMITQVMRDTGKYVCTKCGRGFVLGAGERENPSTTRRVPAHLPKKTKRIKKDVDRMITIGHTHLVSKTLAQRSKTNMSRLTREEIRTTARQCGAASAEPSDAWNKHYVNVYGLVVSVKRTLCSLGIDCVAGQTYHASEGRASAQITA